MVSDWLIGIPGERLKEWFSLRLNLKPISLNSPPRLGALRHLLLLTHSSFPGTSSWQAGHQAFHSRLRANQKAPGKTASELLLRIARRDP